MTPTLRESSVVPLATACVLLGLLFASEAAAQGSNALPLSGPAFVLADEAYKAYAQGNYESAAEKAREAYRLRPDVASLAALARRAESAQHSPPSRKVGEASRPVAESRSPRRPKVNRVNPESPAFEAAQAGYSAYDIGKFDDAVDKASTAVRLAPENARYRLLLINALVGTNRLAEADQAVTAAIAAGGESPALVQQRTAIAQRRAQAPGAAAFSALERKDTASAIANAQSAIRLAPSDSAYRQLLVQALLQAGMFQEAEVAATEAMALDATDASPQVLRGYARQRLDRRADAVSDFSQALSQPTLGTAGRRQVRLIAADAALAAQDPQAALALLKDLPPGADEQADEQVAQRRRAATAALAGRSATASVVAAASFAPPVLDCGRVGGPQRCLVLPSSAGGQVKPGFTLAASAYKAFDDGRFEEAALAAGKAVQLSPDNRDYQLLLINALSRSGQLAEADLATTAVLAKTPNDASLLAQRGQLRQRLGQPDLAKIDFDAALALSAQARETGASPTMTANRLPAIVEIGLLVDTGRRLEARQRFDQAAATGIAGDFDGVPDIDVAYLGTRVGNDAAALTAFNRADAAGILPNSAYQDAAFSAIRAREDLPAVAYFKRAIDDVGALRLRMEPRLLFDTRRAVAEVSREGGVIASLSYRGAVSGLGVTPGVGTDSLQAGVEGYWRPWGYQNGEYVELFARAFQTLYSKNGGAKGTDTLQAAVGVRYKPFATQNLVGLFSRVFSPGGGRNDWLAQLGYSADHGTDLRIDVPSWWTTKMSAELGRYLSEGQNYALAQFQAGRSYRLGDDSTEGSGRWVLYPHISLAADYDSTATDKTSVGLGPGLTGRYWFREDTYAAPRSYLDLSVQYRARIGGAERAKGLFVNTTLSY